LERQEARFLQFYPQIEYFCVFCANSGQIYPKRNARPNFNANNAMRSPLFGDNIGEFNEIKNI